MKRAAIQAKLVAEQAEKVASEKPYENTATEAGADASGQGDKETGDAADPPETDAQPRQVDMPKERGAALQSDGEDGVMIDSDAEGQHAEDLFRETSQQNVVCHRTAHAVSSVAEFTCRNKNKCCACRELMQKMRSQLLRRQ